ncbi:MAG TPA: HAD-IA family hydrolase [Acidimicrobiales bacterium]|nr:HAD-IA family hydrolase [Acidimicrobiales bacterium]
MMEPSFDAVLFDFGGVLADSPFDAFARYEAEHGLPEGFIRSINATNHHDNAWARLERNELDFEDFCDVFEAEAAAAGGKVDARALFSMLTGRIRPAMIEAVRRCHEHFKTGLLTNNFVTPLAGTDRGMELGEVLRLFDVVVESSVVGIRKPDPRFYELACRELAVVPGRAVFLDDLGVNLKPARAMGMATIKVQDPESALAELEQLVGLALR